MGIRDVEDSEESSTPAVRRTDKPEEVMDLTGYLFPHIGAKGDLVSPAFLTIPGSDALYLACFSSVERLQDMMKRLSITYAGIKAIYNGKEFIAGLPEEVSGSRLAVICDPYFTPEGKVRFIEIVRD